MIGLQVTGIVIGIVVLYLRSCIRILFEYQRGVIFRLGRVLQSVDLSLRATRHGRHVRGRAKMTMVFDSVPS